MTEYIGNTDSPALPGVKGSRPYVGNNDGPAKHRRAGTDEFIRQCLARRPQLWNNGSYGVRDMRSKPGVLSVHATGRAWDASWLRAPQKLLVALYNRHITRRYINKLARNGNTLGIEMIIDYYPKPYGAGWRCDRQKWLRYTAYTVAGTPGGRWYHIEINAHMADNPDAVKKAFNKVFGPHPVG